MPLKILMQLMGVKFSLLRSLCADKSQLAMEVLALRPLDRLPSKGLRGPLGAIEGGAGSNSSF